MTTGSPVFGLLATSAVGFKIKVDFHLSSPVRHGFLTFTFGATSINLFAQFMKSLVNVLRHTETFFLLAQFMKILVNVLRYTDF